MLKSRETIVAIATPPGNGAITVIRVSGPEVPALSRRLVRSKSPLRARVATYAPIIDDGGELLDRGLAIRFSAPHSYTGEEMLELQVHGSPVVAREVVRALLACGARLADPGEFTRRAFLNGKMDLSAAAAVADVVAAETRAALRAALANLGGGLAGEVRTLRAALAHALEELAGAIDFPDEVPEPSRRQLAGELARLRRALERLRHEGELRRLIREGVSVAIVGPPNAGKSSLLNALLADDRAIVSEIPGTTRDTIEETLVVEGVAVRLVDTAGIRTHADRLETAGIERTERALEAARIALIVIDGSQALGDDALALLKGTRDRERILFFNKADLGTLGADEHDDPSAILGSVHDERTLSLVRDAIATVGWGGETLDAARPHLASLHEFDAVNAAIEALLHACDALEAQQPLDFVATDLQRAFSALGHVSERVAAEEVIDGIFSRFCIGK
jgi:tRNA modification GTPase